MRGAILLSYVLDGTAVLTAAALLWHTRILMRWSRRIERDYQELSRQWEQLGEGWAALIARGERR